MTTALLVVFCWAAAAETLFALAYGFLFPWYRSELGRQMLIYSATVAALMDLGLLSRFWPHLIPASWAPWVFTGGYGSFAVILTWRLFILLRMWREQHSTTRTPS